MIIKDQWVWAAPLNKVFKQTAAEILTEYRQIEWARVSAPLNFVFNY